MQELISRTISTGVYVITVRKGDIINGMTAAWVTQVSFKPHMLTVAIAPSRYTHGLIQESGYFCVNALPDSATDLARHFGFKNGRKTDKFKGVNYTKVPLFWKMRMPTWNAIWSVPARPATIPFSMARSLTAAS